MTHLTLVQGRHDFTGLRSLHTAHDKLRAPFASLADEPRAVERDTGGRWICPRGGRRRADRLALYPLGASVGGGRWAYNSHEPKLLAVCAGVLASSGRNPEGTLARCDHVYHEHIGRKSLFSN